MIGRGVASITISRVKGRLQQSCLLVESKSLKVKEKQTDISASRSADGRVPSYEPPVAYPESQFGVVTLRFLPTYRRNVVRIACYFDGGALRGPISFGGKGEGG